MLPASTKDRLLEAAQQCYAQSGFDGTSLRALTAAAGVNLAAVNYHFGSKRELLMEMSRSIIEPLNRERMERLERARQAAGGGVLTLEAIFDAFLLPVGRLASLNGQPNPVFLRMIGRFMGESDEFYHAIMDTFFKDVAEAFQAELARALPELPPAELRLRFHFAISTTLGSLAQYHRLDRGLCAGFDIRDMGGLIERLRDFICAGCRGNLSQPEEGGA